MRKLHIAAVLAIVATLFGGMLNYASAAEPKRLICEPAPGLSVDDVKDAGDVNANTCRLAANTQDTADPDREVEIDVYPKPAGGTTVREPLGMNEWMGDQVSLPSPVPADNWLLLHGDVEGNGGCQVAVYGPGQTPEASESTWQAYLLYGGTVEQMTAEVIDYIQPVVERETNGCPIIHQPQGVDLGAELEKALEDEA